MFIMLYFKYLYYIMFRIINSRFDLKKTLDKDTKVLEIIGWLIIILEVLK
jgi:hypothetical protein